MAKSDLNKNRITGERHEAAYQAAWNAIFGEVEQDIIQVHPAAWDYSETCACGRNIKYCKFGTKECPL